MRHSSAGPCTALALLVMVSAILVGCGSSPGPDVRQSVSPASPSAAPSAAPPDSGGPAGGGPSASPEPSSPAPTAANSADPIAALQSTLAGLTWSAHATVSGNVTIGSRAYSVSGIFDVSGGDSHEIRTVKGAGTGAGEWIVASGSRFTRTSAGLWFGAPNADAATDLWIYLQAATGFIDLGPATIGTTSAERLQIASASIGPKALGFVGLTVAKPTATIDVFAVDGEPRQIAITASWTSTASGRKTPVKVSLEYAIDPTLRPQVTAPAEVWATSTSRLFKFSVGHPVDWATDLATKVSGSDQWTGPEYLYVIGYRDRTGGSSLSTIATYFKTHPTVMGWKAVRFVSIRKTTLAGVAARIITTQEVEGKDKLSVVTYLAVRGAWVYVLDVVDLRGSEKSQAAFGAKLVTTFRF